MLPSNHRIVEMNQGLREELLMPQNGQSQQEKGLFAKEVPPQALVLRLEA